MTDKCLSHLHGNLRHRAWPCQQHATIVRGSGRSHTCCHYPVPRHSKNFSYHVCLIWHSDQREQQKNIYLRKSSLSQNGLLWDVTLLSSIFRIIAAWLHHVALPEQTASDAIHLLWVSVFKQRIPGRQALQSFVQTVWSVVSVSCGERNIWSVCFWIAITFSLCVALEAQPVITIGLLPGQRWAHRYWDT